VSSGASLLTRVWRRWGLEAQARRRRGLDSTSFEVSPEQAFPAGAPGGDGIEALFAAHDGHLIHKWLHYLPAYDEQFRRFRDGFPLPGGGRRPLRMLELGVYHGGSLQLWRRYFGPDASIWGVDVDPACRGVGGPAAEVRIGSQADPAFLRRVVAEMGGVDLVLDDGSHVARHQRTSFETLFPLLSDGGLYVVEDTHTAYWRDYGGGRRRGFLGLTGGLVDDLHGWYHHRRPNLAVDAARWVPKVTVYDSMVAIEKRARERPVVVRIGTRSF
jgi:hypothetical protein